ncbi:hypothetical protein EON63_25040, partial [archaeon]
EGDQQHRCYLNTHTMMHVVNNLNEYLMFEVLEVAWCTLQERVKTKVGCSSIFTHYSQTLIVIHHTSNSIHHIPYT